MPIYKRCSRCGRRLPSGCKCPCMKTRHKEYDRYCRDKKSKQYYDSEEWQQARSRTLELDQGIDVYLFMRQGRVVPADTVHHIIPLKDDWNKKNDMDNLMSLHHDTHSMIEAMYQKEKKKTQTELQQMLLGYREKLRQGGV